MLNGFGARGSLSAHRTELEISCSVRIFALMLRSKAIVTSRWSGCAASPAEMSFPTHHETLSSAKGRSSSLICTRETSVSYLVFGPGSVIDLLVYLAS